MIAFALKEIALKRFCNKTWVMVRIKLLVLAFMHLFIVQSFIYSQKDTSEISIEELFEMTIEDLLNVKVSAQKREESIVRVPISVSSYNSTMIKMADLQNVSGLELITPGLRYGESGADARLSIRGTRTNDIRIGSAQVVGTFLDGVYSPSTTQALSQWLDVEKVEVLRGPQGTLYGRNTFGGAINIWSKIPEEGFKGQLNLTYGDYNRRKADGFINIPINDKLQFRLAALGELRDGYVENLNQPGSMDDLKDEIQWMLRTSFLYRPVDNLETILRYSRWERHNNGNGDFGYLILGSVVDPVSGQTDLNGEFISGNPRLGTFGATPDKGPYEIYRDFPYSQDIVSSNVNLGVDYEFENMKIKSISAYNDFRIDLWADGDLSDIPFAAEATPSHSIDFFQELQLFSNNSSNFEWLAGAYYQNSEFGDLGSNYGAFIWEEFQSQLDHDNDPVTPTMLTGNITPGYEWAELSETKLQVLSFFGQSSYFLKDFFRLTGGLRYNIEKKEIVSWWLPMSWSPDLEEVNKQSNSWKHITWRAGAEFFVKDSSLVYSNISTGFRAGGFNTSTSPKPTYEEEEVYAFEIGFKTSNFSKNLMLNIAAFYNQFINMQSQELVVLPAQATVIPVTSNAGDVYSFGSEAEIMWMPFEKFNVRATLAYLHAEFGDYVVSNPFELGDDVQLPDVGFINLKGTKVPMSPQFSTSLQLSYKYSFKNKSSVTTYFQSYYSSEFWTNDINVPGTLQEAYTKSDFRLLYNSGRGWLSLGIFVKNIENVAVLNRTIVSSSGRANIWANYMPPRTIGIEMSLKF